MAVPHETTLGVAPDHPSLPGHFPGSPVVPGVVILDRVLSAAEAWLERPLHARGLPQVKFLAPLLPGEEARLRLELDAPAGLLRFRLECAGRAVAQGSITLAAEPAP